MTGGRGVSQSCASFLGQGDWRCLSKSHGCLVVLNTRNQSNCPFMSPSYFVMAGLNWEVCFPLTEGSLICLCHQPVHVYRQGHILFLSDQAEGDTIGNETRPLLRYFASFTDFKSASMVIFFPFYIKKNVIVTVKTWRKKTKQWGIYFWWKLISL